MPRIPLSFSPAVADALAADRDLRVVLAGGRGWLGRAALEMLEGALGDDIASRVAVFGSSNGRVELASGRALPTRQLPALAELPPGRCLFLHFSFLTKDKVVDRPLSAFVEANAAISATIEAQARRLRPLGVVMPSSGAATQTGGGFESNPYGFMKLADEARFTRLGEELGFGFSGPRLFNLAGPFINKTDSYVLACIIRDVQAGRPIRLQADKPVIRSYVHVRDLLDVCVADLLLHPGSGPPVFETAGESEIEIGELARRIAQVLGRPETGIVRPALDPARPADRYVGDSEEWRARMRRHGIAAAPLDRQIRDTADYLLEAGLRPVVG